MYIHRGLSHPDVVRYYAVSYPTLEATQEQMDWYASIAHEGTGQWWATLWESPGSNFERLLTGHFPAYGVGHTEWLLRNG